MGWPEATYKAARWVALAVVLYAVASCVAEVQVAEEDRKMIESLRFPECPSSGIGVSHCGS